MLKRSEFDCSKWGCPVCDWPLLPDEQDIELGGMTCACGAWVVLPDKPFPEDCEEES